jgi:hypothetical protein
MIIKLIAKAAVTGVVVYAVAETLNRLKIAQRTVDLGEAVLAKLIPIPGDTQ